MVILCFSIQQLTLLLLKLRLAHHEPCLSPTLRSMDFQPIWTISMLKNNCRVCGLQLIEPPWGDDDQTPSWDICSCCGTEFGYEDCTVSSVKKRREEWLALGAKWADKKMKPTNWTFEIQAAGIPFAYK
jgi:hypothetical protein